jgi:hypothetical protein
MNPAFWISLLNAATEILRTIAWTRAKYGLPAGDPKVMAAFSAFQGEQLKLAANFNADMDAELAERSEPERG